MVNRRASARAFGCALVVLLGASSSARADETSERIARIQDALDAAAPGTVRWRSGWMITHATLALGSGVLVLTSSDARRARANAVSAAESAIGFVAGALGPHAATSAGDELRGMDESTPESRTKKLARAEALLDAAADGQSLAESGLAHVGTLVVALGGASVLYLGYAQKTDAALAFVSAMIGGELRIATAPHAAIEARRDYLGHRSGFTLRVAPLLGGATILGTF